MSPTDNTAGRPSSDASLITSIIHLCHICATFDFAHLFNVPFFPRQGDYERTEYPRFLLGTVAKTSARPKCPWCCLIRRGITRYYPSAPLTEKIYLKIGIQAVHRCNSSEKGDTDPQYRRVEFLEAASDQGDPWEIGRRQSKLKQATVCLNIYQVPPRHNPNLERVAWQFEKYSSLAKEFLPHDITYVFDGLNAFKGLERQMQASSQAEFFWGFPEYEFHKALLWRVPDPQTSSPPRLDFPSWAWGG